MKQIFLGILLLGISSLGGAETWKNWAKQPANPVYTHSGGAASDPAVIKDGSLYRMVVSGNGGGSPDGNSIIMATSFDGTVWSTLANGQNGIVAPSAPGVWDESKETPELIKRGSEYLLFYTGYDPAVRDASDGLVWGDLGLSTSTNGATFSRLSAPVMTRTPNSEDQDGITDPTIVEVSGTLYMVYVGWCTQACALNGGNPAFYVLKAVSNNGGRSWTKQGRLDPGSFIGLQHPEIVPDADGAYSMFYGVDDACSSNRVGIFQAQAPAPFGPYTPLAENPIFCMGTQSFETDGKDGGFPSVINDEGIGRLYYTGVDVPVFGYKIGMAESQPGGPPNDEENLIGYPNPFRPGAGVVLTLAGLAPGRSVTLFTIAGARVVELTADGEGNALWDGKNESGQLVASGVYLALFDGDTKMKPVKIIVQY